MAIRKKHPTSPGVRHRSDLDFTSLITKQGPERSLLHGRVTKTGGRNASGQITVRHRGGGEKRLLRQIDFKRNKRGIPGVVVAIEYDPNRRANIALIWYADGEKRYILAPANLTVGQRIVAAADAEVRVGNALPLASIPIGTPIHNLEIKPGKGGQLVRGAGTSATIQSKEEGYVTVSLPSKEQRLVRADCYATVGQVGNAQWKSIRLGKAGRRRHMGIRPTVRGLAMHPAAHPHGGGEGRSGIGMPSPKSPWGKIALGGKTRKGKKYSDRMIITDRRTR